MIEAAKRQAIYSLHEAGMSSRQIAEHLQVSRWAVKSIIKRKGAPPASDRRGRIIIDEEHIIELYSQCQGYVQRMHELLKAEGVQIAYSTLTEKVRQLGLNKPLQQRCSRVPDEPGAESQHDTSVYTVPIGEKKIRVIGSLLYYRYSKIRYLKFYPHFNRFLMKCFFHEALSYWGYCAAVCIIDNTNLARLRGSGGSAVIVSEMEEFSRCYGFRFVCHAINHANRKAGNERSFYTVETNFFPGRVFSCLEDLNAQALEWATKKMAQRPVSKTALIPAQAFEYEKSYLTKIPSFVQPPYRPHSRRTDEYGFIAFNGNYYWVPGVGLEETVVVEYCDSIKLYQQRSELATYQLAAFGTKNQRFVLAGYSPHQPSNRKRSSDEEQKRLRSVAAEVNEYIDFICAQKGLQHHRFFRWLEALFAKLGQSLFTQTIQRALKYRITDKETIERIASLHMRNGVYEMPEAILDEEVKERHSYREGSDSGSIDLSVYDSWEESNG